MTYSGLRRLDRGDAQEYVDCFRALGDATRVQIVSLLATARRPMDVGEISAAVRMAQSTVSHHLSALADVQIVVAQNQPDTSAYSLNQQCVHCFPTAARRAKQPLHANELPRAIGTENLPSACSRTSVHRV